MQIYRNFQGLPLFIMHEVWVGVLLLTPVEPIETAGIWPPNFLSTHLGAWKQPANPQPFGRMRRPRTMAPFMVNMANGWMILEQEPTLIQISITMVTWVLGKKTSAKNMKSNVRMWSVQVSVTFFLKVFCLRKKNTGGNKKQRDYCIFFDEWGGKLSHNFSETLMDRSLEILDHCSYCIPFISKSNRQQKKSQMNFGGC